MSEKGIIKLVTNIAIIIGITVVSVTLIQAGEVENFIVIALFIGVFYIILQVIKKI